MTRPRLHWLRPSCRWTVADVLLLSIPLAGVVLAALGRLAGWG